MRSVHALSTLRSTARAGGAATSQTPWPLPPAACSLASSTCRKLNAPLACVRIFTPSDLAALWPLPGCSLPRRDVFSSLDQVVLMGHGRMLYMGAPGDGEPPPLLPRLPLPNLLLLCPPPAKPPPAVPPPPPCQTSSCPLPSMHMLRTRVASMHTCSKSRSHGDCQPSSLLGCLCVLATGQSPCPALPCCRCSRGLV